MTDVATIDFFSDPTIPLDPYVYLDALVRDQPVYLEPRHNVAIVTGYEECQTVFRDPATYSSAANVSGVETYEQFSVKLEGDDVTETVNQHRDELVFSDQIVAFDPPTHTAHRALLMGLITPKRLSENEEFIQRFTDRQLDEILARGECEFISDFAKPFTLLIVADLLGVPEEDHAMLLEKAGGRRTANADDNVVRNSADGHGPLAYLYDYFADKIVDRRQNPRADVLTGMATATFPDGTTPEPLEAARIASNLFAAGQETTVRLLGTCLQLIPNRPELQARLRAQPELIKNFIEETLRLEGPVLGPFRIVLKTTTLGGVPLKAGTVVFLANGAANRDPRQFENPEDLIVDRANARRHIGFGLGVHTCPGAPLARAEIKICLERLLERTTDIRLSEAHHGPVGDRRWDYMKTYKIHGLNELHLEYTVKD